MSCIWFFYKRHLRHLRVTSFWLFFFTELNSDVAVTSLVTRTCFEIPGLHSRSASFLACVISLLPKIPKETLTFCHQNSGKGIKVHKYSSYLEKKKLIFLSNEKERGTRIQKLLVLKSRVWILVPRTFSFVRKIDFFVPQKICNIFNFLSSKKKGLGLGII